LQAEAPVRVLQADLGDESALERLGLAGPIDLLVNNAGISVPQSFLETSVAEFDRTFRVNVRAAFVLSRLAAADMISRNCHGAIVNVSSQASQVGLPDHTAYCVSKGALDQLTRVMAVELGKHQIRVNSVNPTVTLTPMGAMAWSDPVKSEAMLRRIPLGRFAKPRDVSHLIAYLLSDMSDMVHGAIVPIDGGFLAG